MESIICKNLGKKYKDKTVLEHVNLELEHGKIYGLIGRNGAGKTTLLSIISAQNPATSGEVLLGEEEIWENPSALSHICFSRELNPLTLAMKVKEYFKIAAMYYPHWDQKMADKLVKEFELDTKMQITKLSKGMLSMVSIIVAMASRADFTFFDEPVAGLDVVARDLFYKLLLQEYTDTRRTFVISTHIIDEASDVFEEVIIIKDKGILLKENTQELLERSIHISGRAEAVEQAVKGFHICQEENMGRSKGVTVLLKPGEKIAANQDISIQPMTLQNLFVALCGREA